MPQERLSWGSQLCREEVFLGDQESVYQRVSDSSRIWRLNCLNKTSRQTRDREYFRLKEQCVQGSGRPFKLSVENYKRFGIDYFVREHWLILLWNILHTSNEPEFQHFTHFEALLMFLYLFGSPHSIDLCSSHSIRELFGERFPEFMRRETFKCESNLSCF